VAGAVRRKKRLTVEGRTGTIGSQLGAGPLGTVCPNRPGGWGGNDVGGDVQNSGRGSNGSGDGRLDSMARFPVCKKCDEES